MAIRVSAAEAKAHPSELLGKVAHGNQRFLIERRGKPVAALVSIEELARLEGNQEKGGLLAAMGRHPVLSDDVLDRMLARVEEERETGSLPPARLPASDG